MTKLNLIAAAAAALSLLGGSVAFADPMMAEATMMSPKEKAAMAVCMKKTLADALKDTTCVTLLRKQDAMMKEAAMKKDGPMAADNMMARH